MEIFNYDYPWSYVDTAGDEIIYFTCKREAVRIYWYNVAIYQILIVSKTAT